MTQMAIVGDAFGKPMVRALEDAEADDTPYDLSSLGVIISSGVMWTAEVKQALMARGRCFCLDSLGSSEGVGFASQISAPGGEATTAKFPIGEHTKVLTEDGREVEPGSDERGLLALGGPIPLGYYKDPEKSARHVPRRSATSATRSPATGRGSRPTARSSCSAGAASRSTRAARRSSPKRWRRR